MKTIVAIKNTASTGKSETLRELAQLLISTYPIHQIKLLKPDPINTSGDFSFVAVMNGKTIAIESKGDPSTNLKKRLSELEKFNPDIVVCATRTTGETVGAVTGMEKKGYQTVWTSTYVVGDNFNLVNKLKAKQILELLNNLGLV